MIAQDFLVHMREASPSRSPAEGSVRVLASLQHSLAYGGASMCAHTAKILGHRRDPWCNMRA